MSSLLNTDDPFIPSGFWSRFVWGPRPRPEGPVTLRLNRFGTPYFVAANGIYVGRIVDQVCFSDLNHLVIDPFKGHRVIGESILVH